ncbi:hypothetical protein [Parvibaculum sp.]|uniref:phage tail assembly chaperone n=1 Tax=Parvibaculum sp. TaxID=2024848 RepID=UPI0025F5515D|nr:hypothetical protein [Parvibaculum sp.]
MPLALRYIWTTYHRLRGRKGAGLNGAEPISWPDIDAFMRMTGNRLAPWEIQLLESLDNIFLSALSKK